MSDGVETLKRKVVGVVGRFADGPGPANERGAQGVAHLLLLLVEDLLRHFFPGKAEVAFGWDHAESDGTAGRKVQWPGIGVVIDGVEEVAGGGVG